MRTIKLNLCPCCGGEIEVLSERMTSGVDVMRCGICKIIFSKNYNDNMDLVQAFNRRKPIEDVIKYLQGHMFIDEKGKNVLKGGTEEYENKWKFHIGHNYGLNKAIKLLKERM